MPLWSCRWYRPFLVIKIKTNDLADDFIFSRDPFDAWYFDIVEKSFVIYQFLELIV